MPQVEGLPDTGFKRQFRFLKTTAPWLILGATMFGNGGVFCWYSYINPLLTNVSGFSAESITFLMVLAGFGMVIGNLTGGRLADKFTPGRTAAAMQFIICITLLSIFFAGFRQLAHAPTDVHLHTGFIRRFQSFTGFNYPFLQRRRTSGGSRIQVAFNLGNALGATIGALPLQAGFSYRYPALLGAPFALLGFILLIVFVKKYETKNG